MGIIKETEENSALYANIKLVLAAYRRVLDDSLALDYCRIHGKERVMIMEHPFYRQESKHIRAEYYIKEIDRNDRLIESLELTRDTDSSRFEEDDFDKDTKILKLRMQAESLRRELLSLSVSENNKDELEALNVFYTALTPEEFLEMKNVEYHEGVEQSKFKGENTNEPPMLASARKSMDRDKERIKRTESVKDKTIEYINDDGETVIEEIL